MSQTEVAAAVQSAPLLAPGAEYLPLISPDLLPFSAHHTGFRTAWALGLPLWRAREWPTAPLPDAELEALPPVRSVGETLHKRLGTQSVTLVGRVLDKSPLVYFGQPKGSEQDHPYFFNFLLRAQPPPTLSPRAALTLGSRRPGRMRQGRGVERAGAAGVPRPAPWRRRRCRGLSHQAARRCSGAGFERAAAEGLRAPCPRYGGRGEASLARALVADVAAARGRPPALRACARARAGAPRVHQPASSDSALRLAGARGRACRPRRPHSARERVVCAAPDTRCGMPSPLLPPPCLLQLRGLAPSLARRGRPAGRGRPPALAGGACTVHAVDRVARPPFRDGRHGSCGHQLLRRRVRTVRVCPTHGPQRRWGKGGADCGGVYGAETGCLQARWCT